MRFAIAVLALLLVPGLNPAAPAKAAFDRPQPRLPVQTIAIETANGPIRLNVEMATSSEQQRRGLMYRRQMDSNGGMLFVFPRAGQISFWMKNTYLPLDMLFIRADGTVSSIAAHTKPRTLDPVPSTEPVKAVLELNAGRAAELGIVEGAQVQSSIFANRR
ncbi:MAG TPA: DUF192 domain-containing protein [Rhizomicrobium sp.]|nr:DUF192 domain-containing protein [Rhizomicrobium sp.]